MRTVMQSPLWAAVSAWAIAQILKVVITSVMEKKIDVGCLLASGGMPSSHSAFATALSVVVGFKCGFESDIFAIVTAFALVVMYDACGVRRAVGEQAKVINNIISALNEGSQEGGEKAVKEILGHSPFQVVVGFLLGICVGVIFVKIGF